MSWMNNESTAYFDQLREELRELVRAGQFDAAIARCEGAIGWAERRGDREAINLACCNRCGILITLGRGEEEASRMRRILLGSSHPVNCFLAAYNLSRIHEARRETERGLFYARLALGHAEKSGRDDFLAVGHNQAGGLQLLDCTFDEACESYRRALELAPPEPDRSIMASNIGYCQIMLGNHRQGFRWLFGSLRSMRRTGARTWQVLPHLGLSYAYLDLGKLERARAHAKDGLVLAEEAEYREHVMNALYLLGESEKLLGNELAAFEHFQRLQRDYYPEAPFISEFLMTADIRKLVHLMA